MTDQPQYREYPGQDQPRSAPPRYQQRPHHQGNRPPAYGQPPPGYGQPPPGYGQPPPGYGQPPPGYGQPVNYRPGAAEYAGWVSRVAATLVDGFIAFVVGGIPTIIGLVILSSTGETVSALDGSSTLEGENPVGYLVLVLGIVTNLLFTLWNTIVRQGLRGQSLGKQLLAIQVVKEATGQFLGVGRAFLRWLMSSILTAITCYLNLLWPLWDDKNQTLHDK